MERNANYALVGLISTILLIGMIVFILWLTNFALSQHYDRYNIVFRGPISGLSKGGEVTFNGIKVGEVSDIKLDAKDPNLVVATARVQSDTPVRQDSTATLEPQGITGVNYIQIKAGTPSRPLLKDLPLESGQPYPIIQAEPGGISGLLSGGGDLMKRAMESLSRVNRVLSDENIQKISGIMSDVQSVTAELRTRKAIIADADHTLKTADQAAAQIRDLANSARGLVDGDGKQTITKIGAAAAEIQATAQELRAMLAKLQGPTSDFAANGLPRLTTAISSLQTATEDIDRLVNQIEQDPQGLIGKARPKEVEVRP
ncbi:MAG: MCE family protein [Caulobacteraceae bacterium]|nr:MCE family protein [Caulobacteraceae bacterium]